LPGAPATDLYLDAGFRHMIRGETEAEVSGLTFTHELPGTVGLLGAGLRVSLLDRLSLTLDASYARGREAEELSAALSLTLNH
jgi:outer membrane autotransporter protein